MGDERTGVGAAVHGLQHRRLDLDEAARSKPLRRARTAALRCRSICRESGLTIRSRYRWRTRASGSVKPVRLSGSGSQALRRHLPRRRRDRQLAARGSSTTSPVTLTWSPRSTARRHRSSGRRRTSRRSASPAAGRPSCSTANASPPWSRTHDPAGHGHRLAGAVIGRRLSCSSRIRSSVSVRGTVTGYGSMPAATSSASLVAADPLLLGELAIGQRRPQQLVFLLPYGVREPATVRRHDRVPFGGLDTADRVQGRGAGRKPSAIPAASSTRASDSAESSSR